MPRKTTLTLAALALGLGFASAASAAETITYTYDARGRLIKVVHTGSVNHNVETNYSYDKADNRTNVTTNVP
jgi:YD repeat-containing protein